MYTAQREDEVIGGSTGTMAGQADKKAVADERGETRDAAGSGYTWICLINIQ